MTGEGDESRDMPGQDAQPRGRDTLTEAIANVEALGTARKRNQERDQLGHGQILNIV